MFVGYIGHKCKGVPGAVEQIHSDATSRFATDTLLTIM